MVKGIFHLQVPMFCFKLLSVFRFHLIQGIVIFQVLLEPVLQYMKPSVDAIEIVPHHLHSSHLGLENCVFLELLFVLDFQMRLSLKRYKFGFMNFRGVLICVLVYFSTPLVFLEHVCVR